MEESFHMVFEVIGYVFLALQVLICVGIGVAFLVKFRTSATGILGALGALLIAGSVIGSTLTWLVLARVFGVSYLVCRIVFTLMRVANLLGFGALLAAILLARTHRKEQLPAAALSQPPAAPLPPQS